MFSFLILAAAALPLTGQTEDTGKWAGTWMGDLKAGAVTLRIVFNIYSTNGALSATMDSPDQGVKGIPVSKASTDASSITLEVKMISGSYTGTLSADGTRIEGTWSQNGQNFPIVLKKQEGAFVLERPQEPKPPFPYTTSEVTFTNAKAGVTLAGTLTVPAGRGPFPGVVLVSGSGPQNRDEELMGHKPFAVIADYLSRNGIAVLRYDDRGVGGSKGDFATATTFDFADDAESAFTYLSARPEVDPRRVGIAGHSEGGLIAPIVASRNPKVAFIVMLAGPGLTGEDVLLTQQEAMERASGMDEKQVARVREVNKRIYAIVMRPGDLAANAAEARKAYLDAIESEPSLTDAQRKEAMDSVDPTIAQLATPWMRTFMSIDPGTYLKKVRIPVLAMNGSKDLQVLADPNLAAVEADLKAAGNTRYKIAKLEGLNHLFQHAGTGMPEEYGKITETFAPEALSMMKDWILGVK
jgi:fermentation-respiration switch protein FrsA (DUF1100 family)